MQVRIACLLTLLALLSCAAGGGKNEEIKVRDPSSAQGVALFDDAEVWREYRRLFEKIDTANKLKTLERLGDQADALEIKLEGHLGDDQLASDLVFGLNDLLRAQEAILDKTPGREPRTDNVEKLRESTSAARVYSRLVSRLLAARVEDPWVAEHIFPDLPAYASAISRFSDNVRREIDEGYLESNDEIQELLSKADEALARASEVAEKLPAPPDRR